MVTKCAQLRQNV